MKVIFKPGKAKGSGNSTLIFKITSNFQICNLIPEVRILSIYCILKHHGFPFTFQILSKS